VASVFEGLGFKATTNAKRESRKASPIEVDVWAEKKIADTSFSVYVSCKNWDRAVDRSVIDEETGRVLSFIVIELGKRAEAEKAREIYELVYRVLNELFTSIAPPRLREIASRIAEVRETLKKVEEELTSLLAK
jgi:hypothetical protein